MKKTWIGLMLALVMVLSLAGGAVAEDDMGKTVNLIYYLWGSEGVANPDVLALLNEKLMEDLNCTIEVKYIDWGDINTKYPLLFASGESFDMSHASPTAAVSYYSLASQDVLVDITDMLDSVPALKAAIPEETWAGAKYGGRIFGVPCLYSEFTPYGFAYRDDLREKYGVEPITSLETMEAYLAAVRENETFSPINGKADDANAIYRMFVDMTEEWILAPGLPNSQVPLACESPENYMEIFHPAFTDDFVQFAKRMKEWADAGYFAQDILAAQTSAKDNLTNGISAGYLTHMPDWTGHYGAEQMAMPGMKVNWWSPAVDNGKVLVKAGVDNSTVISATSKNPERALKVIEKLMTDESYYRLFQYGIEGRQYEIVDGKVVQPESYDRAVDGFGFAGWSLRNDEFNIPYATEDPRRYELIDEWKGTAIADPYSGFSFDPTNVSNEMAAISDINNELGRQILLGKSPIDVETAVQNYRDSLTQAGIDTVIAEIVAQLESFTPIGK